MVGHLVDLAEQVAGHHHRHAEPAGQGADELPHLLDARRIQAVGGLVQDQQLRPAQQGPGDPQPLLHTQGVAPHRPVGSVVQLQLLQRLFHALGTAVPHIVTVDLKILPACHVGIEGGKFDDAAHPLQHPVGGGREGLSEQQHAAPGGLPQVGHQLHHCGLSRPVRAQESVDLSLPYMEVHVPDQLFFSNDLGQAVRLQNIRHVSSASFHLPIVVPGHFQKICAILTNLFRLAIWAV